MNTKTINDVKVGDTVYIIDEANGRGKPLEEVIVSKTGTKLITTGVGHCAKTFRKENCRENDNYGHWMIIPDLKAYEDKKEIVKILRKIQMGGPAKDVTLEDARAAAKLLGIEV